MSRLSLREVNSSDMDLLFAWANDPEVRRNSFHTESIPYDDHVRWFQKMMNNDNIAQLLLIDDDVPVGQIRLNIDGEVAEVSYSIAAGSRGRGYGRSILRLIKSYSVENYPTIKKLVAKVKPDNGPSNRLFQSEGYNTEYYYYSYDIIENVK